MIYSALASIGLTLAMVLSGASMFGQERWWLGVVAGAVVAIAWQVNRRVGLLLGVVGMGLLVMSVFGLADDLGTVNRAVFNGMAVGLMLGLAVCAALQWRHFKPYLIELARSEQVTWLYKLLGDKTPR